MTSDDARFASTTAPATDAPPHVGQPHRRTAPGHGGRGVLRQVRTVVADRAERDRMGANGRRWVERWLSPAAVAEAYETLFEQVRAP